MQQHAEELRPLDDHLEIDPETGEIIGEDHKLVVEDLPKIARQMRALSAQADIIGNYEEAELARIREYCHDKVSRVIKQYEFFEGIAKQMLEQSGQKKIEYPGLGKLRFVKQREKVDDSGYNAMSEEEQKVLRESRKGFFKTKIVMTPDKKAIKTQIELVERGESDVGVPGFKILRPPEKFEFVPER
jgi:hypothetical protein